MQLYNSTRDDPPISLPLTTDSPEITIRAGDCIVLVGASGSGKSWTLSLLAEQVLQHTNSDVVYLDLDNRFNRSELVEHERFHLFQPSTPAQIYATVLGLDEWLDRNAGQHVMCVLVDDGNEALDRKISVHLRQTQSKWDFALVIATLREQHRMRTSEQTWKVVKGNDGHVRLMIRETAHIIADGKKQ